MSKFAKGRLLARLRASNTPWPTGNAVSLIVAGWLP